MSFGIVGFGRFGKLWADALSPIGKVFVYDPFVTANHISENNFNFVSLKEVAQQDLVFLIVPISEFEKICCEIKKYVKPNSLIIDCCSVKIYPARVMQKTLPKSNL